MQIEISKEEYESINCKEVNEFFNETLTLRSSSLLGTIECKKSPEYFNITF
jgi:hypothetical protein